MYLDKSVEKMCDLQIKILCKRKIQRKKGTFFWFSNRMIT